MSALPIEPNAASTPVTLVAAPTPSPVPARTSLPRAQPVIPRATYRVQLHADFGFEAARALVPYWAELGISHLYTSPILTARPGSRHGYDVVDHGALNPELGTRADFDRLVETLHAHGMGLVVDIVPNHMGVLGNDNGWWLDVLENGRSSAFAAHFDIDWDAADPVLTGKVLLPILGDAYGEVLERGELRLSFDAARGYFTLHYYLNQLPVDPATYGLVLRRVAREIAAPSASAETELHAVIEAMERLPPHHADDPGAQVRRQDEKTRLKARLAACLQGHDGLVAAIDAVVEEVNGRVGEPASFDALDALIDVQCYRLASWRVAGDQINYRRFFDINELAALRMERDEVFEATHALLLELTASGAIDGLRLDHPDGLADPAGYFRQLQRRHAEVAGLPPPAAAVAGEAADMRLYVVAEKIVAAHEQVPRDWALHGTTGYRFANVVNGLLVDGAAQARLERAWRVFAPGEAEDFDALSYEGRRMVMNASLAGELAVLSNALLRLARADRRTRDFTLQGLRQALAEVVASFPVYRTYIVDAPGRQDRKFIDWAIGRARRRSRSADASVFDFLRRVMLGQPLPGAPEGLAERYLTFARRLQQYTAPVVAKGIEDTALYRHQRLVSVNDVGGEPDEFGVTVAAFHAVNAERLAHRPHAMLTTSTHDAKRSEDTRARIDAISELAGPWRLATRHWSRLNARHRRVVDGAPAPTRNDEYLFYQLAVGTLPAADADAAERAGHTDRLVAAMLKSARESKAVTSWMNPDAAYEEALEGFVRGALDPHRGHLFVADLRTSADILAWWGALNVLTMVVVKTLSPGVPDFYQGHELIELSMVDPDNRRPVDFERRREALRQVQALHAGSDPAARAAELGQWLRSAVDGRAKFWVTWRTLQLRRTHEALLRDGRYLPLKVEGRHARRVVAFARHSGSQWIVVVAGRLFAGLGTPAGEPPVGAAWDDTLVRWPAAHAAPAAFEDAIAGRSHGLVDGALMLRDVLAEWPLAALAGSAAPAAEGGAAGVSKPRAARRRGTAGASTAGGA